MRSIRRFGEHTRTQLAVLLTVSSLIASLASAQPVPDLLGLYDGYSSITVFGCSSPSDNKSTTGTGWIDITEQNSGSFSGAAEFSTLFEGITITEQLTLSGTVTTGGALSGTAASQGNVDAAPSGSAQASYSGSVFGDAIEIQFPGGPVGIEGCNHSGARVFGNRCGTGTQDGPEECDDGNIASGDGCSSGCITEFCGDGIVQAGLGEVCDDGNQNTNDACEPGCMMLPEPDTTLFRVAGVFVLGLMHRRRLATGRISARAFGRQS